MNDRQKFERLIAAALLIAAAVLLLVYARQRLFTQAEPIVLAA